MDTKRVLVINCGSTSTKLAIFEDERKVSETTLRMDSAKTKDMFYINDQLPERMEQVESFIRESGMDMGTIDIIASRGGPFPPTKSGAYWVNQLMADVAHYAPNFEHASALSCQIARKLSLEYGIPAVMYDSISTDEMPEVSKTTGIAGVRRSSGGHVLNVRACARKVAGEMGIDFNEGRFVVAHLGGGISVTTVDRGLITDSTYHVMTPERMGDMLHGDVVDLCFGGKFTEKELRKFSLGSGGFVSHLGTSDALEVENRALAGDEKAMLMYDVMAYQLAKAVGAMVTVVDSEPDAVIFTGALARSDLLMEKTLRRIEKLKLNIVKIPGEMEMEALAGGALRVLRGEEEAHVYNVLPEKYQDEKAFYAAFTEAN